jgi:hypothetical protein
MIYDFIKADEAMAKLKVDPIQFHFLFLLYHRAEGLSSSSQLERFKDQVLQNEDQSIMRERIDKLENLGLLENIGISSGQGKIIKKYNTDYLVPTPKFINAVILEEAGEELWSNYPAAMGLFNGGHFMSRIGDKDDIIMAYARKIKKDVKKHQFVMKQLELFKTMEQDGKITGMGIQKFVASEAWDSIAEIAKDNITIRGDHSTSLN